VPGERPDVSSAGTVGAPVEALAVPEPHREEDGEAAACRGCLDRCGGSVRGGGGSWASRGATVYMKLEDSLRALTPDSTKQN
jgi:hypothetical protein